MGRDNRVEYLEPRHKVTRRTLFKVAGGAFLTLLATLSPPGRDSLRFYAAENVPFPVTGMDGKEHILIQEPTHHFLHTKNFESTAPSIRQVVVIFTGFPEGPNTLTSSLHTNLTEVFMGENPGLAVGQLYLDRSWNEGGLFTISQLTRDLAYALRQSPVPVELVLYSFGAFSLIDLPVEVRAKIRSLTLVSPAMGKETIGNPEDPLFRWVAEIFSTVGVLAPSTEEYVQNITPFMTNLHTRQIPIYMYVGNNDQMISSKILEQTVATAFPYVIIRTENRQHGVTVAQLHIPTYPSAQ